MYIVQCDNGNDAIRMYYRYLYKTNDREIIYEPHELMKVDSVYFSLANFIFFLIITAT